MAAQFGQAPLVSPPALALGTRTASIRPLLRAPHKLRLDGMLHHSLAGAQVLSLYSIRRWAPFTMVKKDAGVAFLFAAAQVNLLKILDVKMAAPHPVTGRNDVKDSSAKDLWRYRLKKTGPEGPKKAGLMCAFARLWGQDRPPLWSP